MGNNSYLARLGNSASQHASETSHLDASLRIIVHQRIVVDDWNTLNITRLRNAKLLEEPQTYVAIQPHEWLNGSVST